MLSKNSLELADTHLLGIRNFGLLRFLCIVLHGTELGILLVQLTNANVISRHTKRHGTRHLTLDGIQMVALQVRVSKASSYDLLLLGSDLLLAAILVNLILNNFHILLLILRHGSFHTRNHIDTN